MVSGEISERGFKCPSDENWQELKASGDMVGFDSWRNSSYGFQVTDGGFHSNLGSFPAHRKKVIAGDQPNLVQKDGRWLPDRTRPNANHGYEYINLLQRDGSVVNRAWSDDTSNGGQYNNFGAPLTEDPKGPGDDIYDYAKDGKGNQANCAAPNDSYLLQSK